jgi:hypothetical protein
MVMDAGFNHNTVEEQMPRQITLTLNSSKQTTYK